jgi:phospholipid/cholesterol/gamma-HCH transport system substrate-binding protein
MIRLRHTDLWVGVLVLAGILVLLGVALQRGALRDWFRPSVTLRILLPEAGVAGLQVGSEVEVLGTPSGVIKRIVIDPDQQMHAEADIDEQVTAFIRRDSEAVIRKRFAVAGAAYVDITRGIGEEFDWDFAVIQAETERAPTETIGVLIDELRANIFPVLEDAGRAMESLAVTMERVERGEGNIGRLLADETLMREAEGTVGDARAAVGDLRQILTQVDAIAGDAATLTSSIGDEQRGLPSLLQRADRSLASLEKVMDDLSDASEGVPAILDNVEDATETLPSVLTQAQLTVYELEQLITQLQGLWFLGGGGEEEAQDAAAVRPVRLPATEVRP